MVVINTETYEEIIKFCSKFKGLIWQIHCEAEVWKNFPDIEPQVLSAILSKESQKDIKHRYHIVLRSAPNLLKEYVSGYFLIIQTISNTFNDSF